MRLRPAEVSRLTLLPRPRSSAVERYPRREPPWSSVMLSAIVFPPHIDHRISCDKFSGTQLTKTFHHGQHHSLDGHQLRVGSLLSPTRFA
jgi:hypothetical protein